MKLLVIEGTDGSGKSTQIKMLRQYFESVNINYRYIHFPRTDKPFYGELIARFLRGDLGDIHEVDPYIVALLYAGDRHDASKTIRDWLKKGHVVLLDRYVYSNIAFQCAKVKDEAEMKRLRQWILDLEFEYYGNPKPDLNILLDVPLSFTRRNLTAERKGRERNYLQGSQDIHETDLDFQQRVREVYHWHASLCDDFKIIDCTGESGTVRHPHDIFEDVRNLVDITLRHSS